MRMRHTSCYSKKITAFLLAMALLFLGGCGKSGTPETLEVPSDMPITNTGQNDGALNPAPGAKGRYLETDMPLPEGAGNIRAMELLSDGRLAVFDGTAGFFVSEDQGETYNYENTSFLWESVEGGGFYVSNAAISKDMGLFVEYYKDDARHWIYRDPNGQVTKSDCQGSTVWQYTFLDDGRLVGGTSDGVYEMNLSEGTMSRICAAKSTVIYTRQIGDRLYIVENDGAEIYNMETGKYEEDQVLADFIKEEVGKSHGSFTEGCHSILIYPGDTEDSLYIASATGLYRHVAGGSVLEELIRGSLSSMGSPTSLLTAMVSFEKDSFLICYNVSLLKAYHYDPEVSAVPEHLLKVYSLTDNSAVRVGINAYQTAHPDVYLQYEVGMTRTDGVTREDAIRNLNTALLSGEGPDILILDGLPMDSYEEKGVLVDLSAEINAMIDQGAVFENVVKAYEKNGSVYGVPAFFSFPVLVEANPRDALDPDGLADTIVKLRAENPEGNIIGVYRGKEALGRMYDFYANDILKEDGTIDQEVLKQYLTLTKRIWDAESQSLNMEVLQMRGEMDEHFAKMGRGDNWYVKFSNHQHYWLEEMELSIMGEVTDLGDYAEIISIMEMRDKGEGITQLKGTSGFVFMPNTALGITASGTNQDAAKDFVISMLSSPVQDERLGLGFPVNKGALETQVHRYDDQDGYAYSIGWGSPDGGGINGYNVRYPNEAEYNQLLSMIERLDVPANTDVVLRQSILELSEGAIMGEGRIEDAVHEIVNRLQIYLTE